MTRPGREVFATLGLLAGLLGMHFFVSDYTARILNLGLIYAIAVLGLNFAFGWAGLITLAQAAFAGLGAYGTAILTTSVGLDPWSSSVFAVAIAAVSAALIGFPMLRLGGHYLALATLGLSVTFEIVTSNWVGVTGGTNGIVSIPSYQLLGAKLDQDASFFPLVWGVLVALTLAAYRIRASRLGRAMIALRDDEIAMKMSGGSALGLKMAAFVIGAVYAALAGVLFAHHSNFVSPGDFTWIQSILQLSMLIVGGEGSILGALLGSILVTFLPEWLRPLGEAYLTFFGAFVLLVLIFLPKGLISLIPFLAPARVRAGRNLSPSATTRDAT